MTHFDLAVIGTGSGNSIVTEEFADWRVAILEEGTFGGTCLNVGCIPTKMFVHPADLVRGAQHGSRLGVETTYDGARWRDLRSRVFGRIDPIAARGRAYREGLGNVSVYGGHATFLDDHTLATGTGEQITADQVVIAAGSRVERPDLPGLAGLPDELVHTSDTVMRLEELPRRMAIVGGGYVSAEFAHVFSALGTEVTQLERGPRLLRHHDEDVADRFTRTAARHWDVRLETEVTGVSPRDDAAALRLSDGTELEADVVLLATGRLSNADRLGLEHTTIAVVEGSIRVDAHQRTTSDGVWALGDVSSRHPLKHVANHEARTVQHNLLHPGDLLASDHRFVPSVVFTHPQIASVGLTSQEAREQHVAHVTATYDYADVAYGWAMESEPGEHFVKLLGVPDGSRLLGAHIIGPEAGLLLQPLVQALSLGTSPRSVAEEQYWPHPSLAEVVENALLEMGQNPATRVVFP